MSIGREDYAERKEARIDRLESRAAKAQAKSTTAYNAARSIMDHIPPGQPILVGHHSEKRHRRDLDKIDRNMRKSVEADRKASYYASRAEAAASNTAISSDDPDALEKLEAKLAKLQAAQEEDKALNAYYRKHKTVKGFPGISDEEAARADIELSEMREAIRRPVPSWQLSNRNAEIITFRELLGKAAKKRRWRPILKRCTALEPKRRYRHAWQITWAARAAQVRRYVLPPLFAVLAFFVMALSGFVAWSYMTDTDFQGAWDSAMGMIFRSNRSWVFDDADIPSLKRSQVDLAPFTGNEQKVFQELLPFLPEDFVYISTGYCDESGNLLFGGFEYSFSIQDGTLYYRSFQGLYAVSWGGFRYVPPEDCAPYAPAVLTLYRMSVFDDRLI